jgi:hypothetical protein
MSCDGDQCGQPNVIGKAPKLIVILDFIIYTLYLCNMYICEVSAENQAKESPFTLPPVFVFLFD